MPAASGYHCILLCAPCSFPISVSIMIIKLEEGLESGFWKRRTSDESHIQTNGHPRTYQESGRPAGPGARLPSSSSDLTLFSLRLPPQPNLRPEAYDTEIPTITHACVVNFADTRHPLFLYGQGRLSMKVTYCREKKDRH